MLNNVRLSEERRQGGFTIIELMIVILITTIVLGVAYTVFSSQQKSYTSQQGVVDIQENLRAGMFFLTREIRMAGYCQDDTNPDAGFVSARTGSVQFTMDIFDQIDDPDSTGVTDGVLNTPWDAEVGFNDGGTTTIGEDIIFSLSNDSDNDGLPNTHTSSGNYQLGTLNRTDVNNGSRVDVVMQNVEAIAFAYAYDSDNDGRPETSASGDIIWAVDSDGGGNLDTTIDSNGNVGTIGSAVDFSDICMVRIWILVRSPILDTSLHNPNTYVVGPNQVIVDDNYRRRLLSASVMCRNLGS